MNIGRSAAAILIGVVMLGFIDQTLERVLVTALAAAPPVDEASYLAVRNRPAVLVMTLISHALAATLAGYILAKIAGTHEVRHAMAAAAVLAVIYVVAFVSENVLLPPVWVRVAMLAVTPPALIAGASIRAQARSIQQEAAAPRPEERS